MLKVSRSSAIYYSAAPSQFFDLLQLEHARRIKDAVQIGVQARADGKCVRPGEPGFREHPHAFDDIAERRAHAVPIRHWQLLATSYRAQPGQPQVWFTVEDQSILRLRSGRRRSGSFARIQRYAEYTARLEIAPVDPEILVEQRERQKAPAADGQLLVVGVAQQVDPTAAASSEDVVRQGFDARTERANQVDESPAYQYRLRGADDRLVDRRPLSRSKRRLVALQIFSHGLSQVV